MIIGKIKIQGPLLTVLILGVFFPSVLMSQGTAQQFFVSHQGHQLFAKIVLDEKSQGWSGDLPSGWKTVGRTRKPNKYFCYLDAVTPLSRGGRTVFLVSRWNFVNGALQDGFTEETVVEKLLEMRKMPEIRFKEDIAMEEARQEFGQLGEADIQELINEGRIKVDFSISSKGVIAVRTTTKRIMKLFVENYSSAGYITVCPVADGRGHSSSEKVLVKMLEYSWRTDLDGDGLIDIQWNPISYKGSSSFGVLQDYSIALIKIYKR